MATRVLDITLAMLAILTILLFRAPTLILAIGLGQWQSTLSAGKDGRLFYHYHLQFPLTRIGKWLQRLEVGKWPQLINILKGDMAWVGPSVVGDGGDSSPHLIAQERLSVKPGWISLYDLRLATAVHYQTEAQTISEYINQRSLAYDLRLLVLYAWVRLWQSNANQVATPEKALSSTVRIGPVTIDNLSMNQVVENIRNGLIAKDDNETQKTQMVSFVNPHCVNIARKDRDYREVLSQSEMVLPDGIGIKLASEWLSTPIIQNVNGTDLFPNLCTLLQAMDKSVYLLGAKQSVVEGVVAQMNKSYPRLRIQGYRHGFFSAHEEARVVADIANSGADVLLVAMGVPIQEKFIYRNMSKLGVKWAFGVGGLFDFVSGRISRAPQWMRDAGLEWIWRFLQEPARMWRRYMLGNVAFVASVLWQKVMCAFAVSRIPEKQFSKANSTPLVMTEPVAVMLATYPAQMALSKNMLSDDSAGLLPFGPATFVEQTIESLVQVGIRNIVMVSGGFEKTLKEHLGDGRRLGVTINWDIHDFVARHTLPKNLLLVSAHAWMHPEALQRLMVAPRMALRMEGEKKHSDLAKPRWTGFAHIPSTLITQAVADRQIGRLDYWETLLNETQLPLLFNSTETAIAKTPTTLLQAQECARYSYSVDWQTVVWIEHEWGFAAANSYIDPQAEVIGPVWLSSGTVIRKDAKIGPFVTLGENVVIDSGVTLSSVVIPANHFVGRTA